MKTFSLEERHKGALYGVSESFYASDRDHDKTDDELIERYRATINRLVSEGVGHASAEAIRISGDFTVSIGRVELDRRAFPLVGVRTTVRIKTVASIDMQVVVPQERRPSESVDLLRRAVGVLVRGVGMVASYACHDIVRFRTDDAEKDAIQAESGIRANGPPPSFWTYRMMKANPIEFLQSVSGEGFNPQIFEAMREIISAETPEPKASNT